ncbi:hypothetical protein [Streptomyces sp.]|uniref:hypothetical protein n=1 Tax=Streptomyces sp. TaxID=1931 RepID=UPI002F41AC2D
MAMSGPQRYPGASTTYWWQSTWGGDPMEVNVVVLHTTEGTTLPGYSGGADAPNFTAVPDVKNKRLNWYQHFDFDVSSRALQNLAGGVQTNTLNVSQVELVGTCDDSKATTWGNLRAGVDYLHWPTAPDWALQEVADFLAWAHREHGVPLTGPSVWLAYGRDDRRPGVTPASYGASPARMSFAQWSAFKGICGHQHVPENVHGDPGSLPFTKLLAMASSTYTPDEDTVPLTDAEIDKIADAAAEKVRWFKVDDPIKTGGDQTTLGGLWWETAVRVNKLLTEPPAAPVLTDAQLAAIATKVAASPALASTIAEQVAAKIAARLQS